MIILAIAVAIVAALWLWLTREAEERDIPPGEAATIVADDLTRVEGIGPKISGLLQGAGVSTFQQLAGTGVDRLERILADANLAGLANPSTWPEQARLAAEGDWQRLETLQEELTGGRRA